MSEFPPPSAPAPLPPPAPAAPPLAEPPSVQLPGGLSLPVSNLTKRPAPPASASAHPPAPVVVSQHPGAPAPTPGPVFRPTFMAPDQVSMLDLPSGLRVPASVGRMRSTVPFGAVMLALYAVVVGALIRLALHLGRGYTWASGIRELGRSSTRDREYAQAFDDRTAQLLIGVSVCAVLAAIATAVWSNRVVRNFETIGQRPVNVAQATVAWLIPVYCLFGGFKQLRRGGIAESSLMAWQILLCVPFIGGYLVGRALGASQRADISSDGALSAATIFSTIKAEWVLSIVFVVGTSLALICAVIAVVGLATAFREINRARSTA